MSSSNTHISVEEFCQQMQSAAKQGEECVLIDVRTPEEYIQGHIASAKLLPLNTLPGRAADVERDRTVYLICQGGIRSAQAMDFLAREHGHTNLINISGGTMAWINAGRPVEQGEHDAS